MHKQQRSIEPASARVSFASCVLLMFAAGVNANEEFSVEQVRESVFAIVRGEPPGFAVESNSGFIVCADHVVVIDAQSNDAATARVLSAIRRHTSKPVR